MSRRKTRITVKHCWALGDTVLMTALIRDIHRAYPGMYETNVASNWSNVWWNNPYLTRYDPKAVDPKPMLIEVGWPDAITGNAMAKIGGKKEMRHILAWYHYDFERKTGIKVPCTEPYPDLHLTPTEKKPFLEGRYWVVVGGGKMDITNKHWWVDRYQAVVNRLTSYGIRCVQTGATHSNHFHPVLDNCLNMIGKTDNARDLFNIIMHADGVICPVTGAMHIAAAFQRPCVVLAGGREEPWFEWYGNGFQAFGPDCQQVATEHKFLHTLGHMYCCDKQGCWKKRAVPLDKEDRGKKAKYLCKEPVRGEKQAIAGCMDMIQVDHVVEAVMEYYDDKILPPIGKPKGKYPALPDRELPTEATSLAEELSREGLTAPPEIRIPTTTIQPPPEGVTAELPPPPEIVRSPTVPIQTQRASQKKPPREYMPAGPKDDKFKLLDNPTIGGKFTLCVLCYGPHPELAKQCINSILNTVPRARIDLRIATNAACDETLRFVRSMEPDRLYINQENQKKYPVMRSMFRDKDCPIRTPYVIWFDDDAYVVDPKWILRLSEAIIANHKRKCRLYGIKNFHDLNIYTNKEWRPDKWFRQASWFKGAHLRVRGNAKYAPNGSCIDFCPGWFWAIGADAIKAGDIPDARLNHNGGDITIGEQVHQAGFKIKKFNDGKVYVSCPTKEQGGRRVGGYEESFPWVPPNKKFARIYQP